MKKPATVRPDKAMTEAMKNVPGALFAKWFKIGLTTSSGRAMAFIPADASGVGRDRLFFVGARVAVEVILACPKCRKELYEIGAKWCRNCGFRIVPAPGKRTKLNWLRTLSIVFGIFGLATSSFKNLRGMTLIMSFFSLAGLVLSFAGRDLTKVRLLFKLDTDGKFRSHRVLKIDSKGYTSPNVASFVGRILYSELLATAARKNEMMRLAQQASERPAGAVAPFDVAERQTHDPGRGNDQSIACGAENLSQAFSLGKRDLQ